MAAGFKMTKRQEENIFLLTFFYVCYQMLVLKNFTFLLPKYRQFAKLYHLKYVLFLEM